MMSPEKIRGTQFEIWLEVLLKGNHYHMVKRNLYYHRSRYQYRQVDLEYFNLLNPFESFVILELKYTSNGKVKLRFRDGKKTKSAQLIKTIDNIVSELEERRMFVKADHAILVTNGYFEQDVHALAKKYGIDLWEREKLIRFDANRRRLIRFFSTSSQDIDNQIKGIDLRNYDTRQKISYT